MAGRTQAFFLLPLVLPLMAGGVRPAHSEAMRPGVEERQDALVGELAACESGTHPNPDRNGYLGGRPWGYDSCANGDASGNA